jgi:hypothetical protein
MYRPFAFAIHFACAVMGLLGSSLLAGRSAPAATLKTYQFMTWTVTARSDDQTKQFDRCSAQTTYPNGVSIAFSVDRRYSWGLALSNPAWDFVEGTTFGIVLRLSERDFLKEDAVAIDHQLVEVQLSDPTATFEKLRKATTLQVMAGAMTVEFGFGLSGPGNVLSTLMQCVAQQAQPAARPVRSAGTNVKPSAPARAALNLNPASNPAGPAEAATLIDGLLAEARISNFQHLAREQIPSGMRGDVAWTAGAVTGTASIIEAPPLVDEIVSTVIGNDTRSCRGNYFAGTLPDTVDGASATRVFTACQVQSVTSFVHYLAVPRATGGFYLLATMATAKSPTDAVDQTAKDIEEAIRKALQAVSH